MAIQNTRQFMFADDPSFNLGMDANAFRNLGMGELADIQNLGLMGLPGANNVVANPAVVENIVAQAANQNNKAVGYGSELIGGDTTSTTARDLFNYYATGFNPDQAAIDFWNNKIATTGYENTLNEFLNPAQGSAAPRFGVMSQDPDYLKIAKPTPVIPAADVKPEPREIVDTNFQGDADVFSTVGAEQANVVPSGPANVEARTVTDTGQTQTQATTPAVDTSNFPKFEGKPYDPAAYDNIVKQLTAQQQALLQNKGFQYTSTFGGATETIQDMAKRLAAMGISDIRDFGMKHELPVEKVYETIEQSEGPALTFDTGRYRTIVGQRGNDAEGNPIFDYRDLTPEEVEKLKFKDGMGFLPVDQIKRADLKNSPYANTVYYNKKTGQEINTRQFGGKAESGLFASSGAGDGYTNYRVVYDEEKGIPVFLPEKNLSGMKEFIAEDLSGILSVLRFIPGAQIPVMLAQAAAAAYMGAKPEDILKQAATTYLASNIGKLGDKFLPQLGFDMPTSDLGKLALQSGYSGLASLIQGGDLEDALKSAGMSAIGTGISGLLPKGGEGDINYGKLIQAAAPALAKGKLTNADIFRILSSLTTPTKPIRGGR